METKQVNEKETLKEIADGLVQHTGEWLGTFYKKSLLQVTQKAVNAGASIISAALATIIALFVLLFAGFGLAWWIGDLMQNRAAGFFIIAAFYLLLLVILLASKKSIISVLRNWITRKIYD